MPCRSPVLLTLVAVLIACTPVAGQTDGTPPPVLRRATVDCGAGQSLRAALQLPGDQLEIEVLGLCRESITVQRDSVTLIGGDPQRDGVLPPDGVPTEAALVVRAARGIRIENLSLAGSTGDGIRVIDAPGPVQLIGCRLEGNGAWGATIVDSEVAFERSVITGNRSDDARSGGGLLLTRGSSVRCAECVVGDNPSTGATPGVAILSSSRFAAVDSTVAGRSAVAAQLHSSVSLTDTELLGTDWAIEASYESEVFVRGGEIYGAILAADRSALQIFGAVQTFNPARNFVTESSSLLLDDRISDGGTVAARLEGETLVSDFSTAKVIDGSSLGDLTCALDARVYCDGSETKTSSNGCGRCP